MNEVITTSEELARKLAQAAISIRENIKELFLVEEETGHLHQIFQEIQFKLMKNLTLEHFADIYAQTITYGLFSLKIFQGEGFDLNSFRLSNKNSFLHNFLENILRLIEDQSTKLNLKSIGINKLLQLMKTTNIALVMANFSKYEKSEDPIMHFYEEFLHEYDSSQKIDRGVFYTPDALVKFIVHSVNHILQTYFNCEDGLVDESQVTINGNILPKIQILDPAAGTGTFLNHIIELSYKLFKEKYKSLNSSLLQNKWEIYVDKSLLLRVFAFELLMAPYVIANIKLGLKLQETGYTLQSHNRLGVFLANTLEDPFKSIKDLEKYLNPFSFLSREGKKALEIKMEYPISVIIGNPPYSGHSLNKSQWITDLLHGKKIDETRACNYFEVDGKLLGEKNPKWLNDDYVKFIRFGQWRIEKTGYGVVAFITNHSFLDNPTFRGMRQQLMKSFTDIFIIDLHGNTRRNEKTPSGLKDENVFDIQQGVCISFFIKNPNKKGSIEIFRYDVWGLRNQKYEFLNNNDISTIKWNKIDSFSPWYMFYQLDMKRWKEYKSGWIITDIFPIHSVGIMTGQDKITIHKEREQVREVIEDLILLSKTKFRQKYDLKKEKRQWALIKAIHDIQSLGLNQNMAIDELNNRIEEKVVPILYRPFDKRFTFYTGRSRGFHERPRSKVMRHMINGDNLGLVVSRNSRPASWRDIQITEDIIELGVMATRPGNNAPIFPLFLFRETTNGYKKEVNFSNKFKRYIKLKYGLGGKSSVVDVMYYIYAILHSKEYRTRYESFLKIDFPRIPFPTNPDLFFELHEIGRELAELYLMKSVNINDHNVRLRGSDNVDSSKVKRVSFTSDNKIRINSSHFFEGVSEEVYEFHIGGYQVCRRWLRNYRDKILTKNDILFFGRIVKVIQETIRLMEKIDSIILQYQGWPEAFLSKSIST
ncbi:MAG: type ISP restriction/modification enzyme [Promethearchaeota archaeon]